MYHKSSKSSWQIPIFFEVAKELGHKAALVYGVLRVHKRRKKVTYKDFPFHRQTTQKYLDILQRAGIIAYKKHYGYLTFSFRRKIPLNYVIVESKNPTEYLFKTLVKWAFFGNSWQKIGLFTYAQIARDTGVSLETVKKVMQVFRRKKIITKDFILDEHHNKTTTYLLNTELISDPAEAIKKYREIFTNSVTFSWGSKEISAKLSKVNFTNSRLEPIDFQAVINTPFIKKYNNIIININDKYSLNVDEYRYQSLKEIPLDVLLLLPFAFREIGFLNGGRPVVFNISKALEYLPKFLEEYGDFTVDDFLWNEPKYKELYLSAIEKNPTIQGLTMQFIMHPYQLEKMRKYRNTYKKRKISW